MKKGFPQGECFEGKRNNRAKDEICELESK